MWGDGNILLGGGGSDLIEGRGADDIIDGDKYLNVRLSVRNGAGVEIGSAGVNQTGQSAMTSQMRDSNGALILGGKTLQQAVFAGDVDPGNIVAVREIVDPPASDHGVDRHRGVLRASGQLHHHPGRRARHGDRQRRHRRDRHGPERRAAAVHRRQTVTVAVPNAPTNVTATRGNRSATVTWVRSGRERCGDRELRLRREVWYDRRQHDDEHRAGRPPRTVTGLNPGQKYTFEVRAVNQFGAGAFGVSNEITAAGTPTAPTALAATRGNSSASLSWTPGADNSSAITGYTLQIRNGATVVETRTITGNVSSAVISGLNNGTAYNFRLQAINGVGTSPLSAASNTVTPATLPGLVQIGAPTQGAAGGALTASANWNPPLSNGGATITNYRVRALRMAADGDHGGVRPGQRHRRSGRPHQVVHAAGRQLPVRRLRHQRRSAKAPRCDRRRSQPGDHRNQIARTTQNRRETHRDSTHLEHHKTLLGRGGPEPAPS